MKKIEEDNCLKCTTAGTEYKHSDQIRAFINAINFICLFTLYPFACYGLFLSLKGLYLCDISRLIDSGLVSGENLEMLFRGLTDIILLLLLFPFILLVINYLWKLTVKTIKKEMEEGSLKEG